ncbi:hypothetical protein SAMN02800692_1739 [Luteibacter sp. UNC138MFCol5.1]|uniref:hypothetical protein n=1 Tax=Luteibacter sp. UNC138MFCol5.1 TaxID=1502774 RepID=UPI0008AEC376|nr:hypothetical protein [Luteibacter sp. UNC138MFCol5.1]SEO67521.1 hypothetical protein SAMN02800692_1739 [Luteibacter sp. UNC138MFCol5.1]
MNPTLVAVRWLARPVCALLFLAPLVAGCSSVLRSSANARTVFPYCNVYTANACFGIGRGGKVVTSPLHDYVLYDVTLSDGAKARIYSGYNPDKSRFERASPCRQGGTTDQCSMVRSRTSIDLLYGRDGEYLDVHVEASGDSMAGQHIRNFIQSFRPCEEDGAGLRCAEVRIFSGLP